MPIPDLEMRVKQILTSRLGIPAQEISPDAKLAEDLGMDSLDAVEFAIAAEREFDLALSDEQVAKLRTVADIMGLVARLHDEQAGSSPAGERRPWAGA